MSALCQLTSHAAHSRVTISKGLSPPEQPSLCVILILQKVWVFDP